MHTRSQSSKRVPDVLDVLVFCTPANFPKCIFPSQFTDPEHPEHPEQVHNIKRLDVPDDRDRSGTFPFP
jgi:hypothetical protein